MRCLFAASEVAGFAKTGGLADVASALPRALAERGVDTAIIMPLYRAVHKIKVPLQPVGGAFSVPIRDRLVEGRLFRAVLPGSKVPVFLVDQASYFDRAGLYQDVDEAGNVVDHGDNCERFVFFSRAILEAIRLLDFWPDVLHANDWQTGLVPVYLREIYCKSGPRDNRARYQKIRTLFTIHNLAYQGLFWHLDYPILGLSPCLFNSDMLEFYGRINFLKAGLVFADALTTVSPTYAREIQTAYYGCGLQGVLLQRNRDLTGIVNGVDYTIWNPARDPFLPMRYDASNVVQGKRACKKALQTRTSLPHRPATPILGMVSRLVQQKGVDLIIEALPRLLDQDVQVVMLGVGDPHLQGQLETLQQNYRTRLSATFRLDEPMVHLIEAGADMFLMPSQYEPCGLNQLYSLKYGTIPLVRTTGGLADTVIDATPANVARGTASGFTFVPYAVEHFLDTVTRALGTYRDQPAAWHKLQETGMAQDWSWERSAAEYDGLYRRVAKMRRPMERPRPDCCGS